MPCRYTFINQINANQFVIEVSYSQFSREVGHFRSFPSHMYQTVGALRTVPTLSVAPRTLPSTNAIRRPQRYVKS